MIFPESFHYSLVTERDERAVSFGKLVTSELHFPPQLAEILYQRGVHSLEGITEFLYPQLSSLPSPYLMRDMYKAVDCIMEAYKNRKTILIHGDYDVDGISATVLAVTFFREIGMKVVHYIPNRLHERYGLSHSSIDRLLNKDGSINGGVLLTVDCGTSSVDEVAYAKNHGLRVIITDHHEPPALLPASDAILNPKLQDCDFPYKSLAGVGVTFFLAMAFRSAMVEKGLLAKTNAPNLKKYLDLVALGTVADVVPLTQVNRTLVKAGLEVLSAKQRPGVFSLCEQCGLQDVPIQTEDISFKLAPRINASGRLGNPDCALDLLLAPNISLARKKAGELEKMNSERRAMEPLLLPPILKECEAQLAKGRKILIIHAQACHPGVIGILAARVVDHYGKPAVIFTEDNQSKNSNLLKGSGRSVQHFNLYTLLNKSRHIDQFGGHAMAVGLTININDFNSFAEELNSEIGENDLPKGPSPVSVEYFFNDKTELTINLINSLQLMQPFGEGNPEPMFLMAQQKLLNLRTSKGHLFFTVKAHVETIRGVGFKLAAAATTIQERPVTLVCKLRKTWYRGEEGYQIQAVCIATI